MAVIFVMNLVIKKKTTLNKFKLNLSSVILHLKKLKHKLKVIGCLIKIYYFKEHQKYINLTQFPYLNIIRN
jgi:hypothetical protein